ncbi:MAG: peptidoglycan-binding domain-containing protein, partial [Myxococcales bacterium]
VMIFLFAQGTKLHPDLKKWPCPRAKEGIKRCQDHLWSDSKDRLDKQYPYRRRRFGKQVRDETDRMSHPEMTFGCRFYHAIALRSPCERDLQMFALRVLTDATTTSDTPPAERLVPVANARFAARIGVSDQSAIVRGVTTDRGMIGVPYLGPQTKMELRLDVAALVAGQSGVPQSAEVVDLDVDILPTPPEGESGTADSDQFEGENAFRRLTLGPDRLARIFTKVQQPTRPEDPPPPEPPPEPRPAGMPETQSSLEPDADEPPVTPEEQDLGVRQRLYNLGFGSGPVEQWKGAELARYVRQFQRDHKPPLEPTGVVDPDTLRVLYLEHGS